MSKAKSFLKSLSIDNAKHSHNCQHSKEHRILKGEVRLGLKDGRSNEYYCKNCAISFLEKSAEAIARLLVDLRK